MKFKPDNGIRCYQDHCTVWYEHIPADLDWTVVHAGDTYTILKAPGFGVLERDSGGNSQYGNGAITAMATTNKLLTASVDKDLAEEDERLGPEQEGD